MTKDTKICAIFNIQLAQGSVAALINNCRNKYS